VRGYLVERLRRVEVDQGFDTLVAGLSWVAGLGAPRRRRIGFLHRRTLQCSGRRRTPGCGHG